MLHQDFIFFFISVVNTYLSKENSSLLVPDYLIWGTKCWYSLDNFQQILPYIWQRVRFSLFFKFLMHSVQFSCSVMSDFLRPHGPQHARPCCPSPTPGAHPNPCPLSRWCHPTISSPVVCFSSCPQSFPASGSFQISQFFASGGQNIGVSASLRTGW